MSLRTAFPTFFRVYPTLSDDLRTAARFALHLVAFRWWTWRFTRRLLLGSAVLATLIGLFYTVENWRGRRAFAAITREAAAAELSFNLGDRAQPPVSDDQNLAKIPLFDAPDEPNARREFWNKLDTTLNPQRRDGTTRTTPNYLPYTVSRAFENRPADLTALRAEIDTLSTNNNQETFDAYLSRLAPLLADLNEATTKRPYMRYDYNWAKPMDIEIPQFGQIRTLAQIATLQALVHLENNRPADAAHSLTIPLRLRSAVQRDPLVISQLLAFAIENISTGAVWEGQLDHLWTTAELDLISRLLADDKILDSFRNAYASEAAWGITILLQLPESLRTPGYSFADDRTTRSIRPLVLWAPSGWLYQNATIMGRYYLDEVLPSIDTTGARVYPEKIRRRDDPASPLRPYSAIADIMIPSVNTFPFAVGRSKTNHDLARLAVSLEKHLLTHDVYPDSLAPVLAADPALAALHDPYDGQPYRYRRDPDGGFTLWGVGQNLRDDGGAYPGTFSSTAGDRANYTTGDLVWRVPAPNPDGVLPDAPAIRRSDPP